MHNRSKHSRNVREQDPSMRMPLLLHVYQLKYTEMEMKIMQSYSHSTLHQINFGPNMHIWKRCTKSF